MQVNLLALNDDAIRGKRLSGVLLSLPGDAFGPLLHCQTGAAEVQSRRAAEHDPLAGTPQEPTRSVDVINEAERKVDRSSREFQRRAAHDSGVEQFRQARQESRQALREKDAAGSARDSFKSGGNSPPKSAPPAAAASTPPAKPRPVSDDRARMHTTESGPNPSSNRDVADATFPRATLGRPTLVGQPGSAAMPIANPVAAYGFPNAVSAIRTAAVLQVQSAARPAAAGNAKGGAQPPGASAPARGTAKGGGLFDLKANAARAAECAQRTANIERIVRIIAQRIGGERSHTVMRLDPPELGSLRLQMDLRGEALTLRIDTSTHVAHRLLTDDAEQLRQGLEAAGIRLERIDIRPPAPGPETAEQGDPRHGDLEGEAGEGFGEPDAEHPEEHGRDSHPARSDEGTAGGADSDSATESLLNIVA
jgi:hypothetical protein